MKYSIRVAQMFATVRTRIAAAGCAVFDTCCFRRRLKTKITVLEELLSQEIACRETMEETYKKDEESARAQLCQLRVNPESVRGRIGFMVSAFVPTDVLTRLQKGTPAMRKAFHIRVCSVLMEHVLKGLFRVTAKGTMTAMIFEPLGPKSNKRIVSPIFETADGKHAIVHPPANSLDVRTIQEAQQRQLNS